MQSFLPAVTTVNESWLQLPFITQKYAIWSPAVAFQVPERSAETPPIGSTGSVGDAIAPPTLTGHAALSMQSLVPTPASEFAVPVFFILLVNVCVWPVISEPLRTSGCGVRSGLLVAGGGDPGLAIGGNHELHKDVPLVRIAVMAANPQGGISPKMDAAQKAAIDAAPTPNMQKNQPGLLLVQG